MMAQLELRKDTKRMLIKLLRSQGYATYARLLLEFDIYLTDDPDVIGYMVPGEAMIVLNKNLSKYQVSVIIRHEILHDYLKHPGRKEEWIGKNPEYQEIDDHNLTNIAADLEISNRAYTDADKADIRGIRLNDRTLSGLVTEDHYPGWEDMTFEDMLRKLLDQKKKDYESLKPLIELISQLNNRSLDDIRRQGQEAQQNIDDAQEQQSQDGQGGEGQAQGEGPMDDKDGNGENGNNPTPGEEGDPGLPSKSGGSNTSKGKPTKGNPSNPGSPKSAPSDRELSDMEKGVDKAQSELNDIQKQVNDSNDSTDGGLLDSEAEQQRRADLARRVQKIADFFNDASIRSQIIKEAEAPVKKERADKAAKAEMEYRKDPLRNFKISLNDFIATQLRVQRDRSTTRTDPSYEDTDFLIMGMDRVEKYTKPIINVYHDVSASFKDESKTKAAMSAIASLNEYKKKDKIDIEYYFFADWVSKSKSDAEKGWGTRGEPILQHIAQTKPTNVIIITDSDIDDCVSTSVVPGAVWMLFYETVSQNLIDHIRGKKKTKTFLIPGAKK